MDTGHGHGQLHKLLRVLFLWFTNRMFGAHVDHPSCIMLGPRQSLSQSQSPEILAPRKKVVSGAEISLMGAGVRDGVE